VVHGPKLGIAEDSGRVLGITLGLGHLPAGSDEQVGDRRLVGRRDSKADVGSGFLRDLATEELTERHARYASDDFGAEPPECQCVVAGHTRKARVWPLLSEQGDTPSGVTQFAN
jgi:hypothetical protein